MLCLAAGLISVACATGAARPPLDSSAYAIAPELASDAAVTVGMYEYHIDASVATYRAGRIDFVVTNKGREQHEFVIVPRNGERYRAPLTNLPSLESGESRAVRMTLPAGRYSLVCLMIVLHGDTPQAHMNLGMESAFQVTG